MHAILSYTHLLAASVLVGKVVLLSFVVAPVLSKTLKPESFGRVVRSLFPAYYALGMLSGALGLSSVLGLKILRGVDLVTLVAMGSWMFVLASEGYCRSLLTPHSNEMRDRLKEQEAHGSVDQVLKKSWERLHRLSVSLNSAVLIVGLILLAAAGRVGS